VITAGPTREAIDPVRYISNHSSGKMGYALAQAAQRLGATVTIISGPVTLTPPEQCRVINVNSALDMYEHALAQAPNADVFIACAAVADYRIDEISEHKIKKSGDTIQLNLVKNPDIVASVAGLINKPFTVGFAAETQDVAKYAKGKLKAKNLDLIAANNVATSGQGFNSDNNALTVFSAKTNVEIPLSSKQVVANYLVAIISKEYKLSK
jgi:phosphopantothenoylcysteine decarboxylase/phosphopantothenate--cysteine ligase